MSSKKRSRTEACSTEEEKSEKEEEDEEEEEEDEDSSDSSVESDLVSGQGWNKEGNLTRLPPPQEVNVQFEVKPIVDEDHQGIRRLLQQVHIASWV